MFKLEKVMDDFRASAPERRQQNNPNMDFVPFEDMKKRILKIVDSYIGWVKKAHFNCFLQKKERKLNVLKEKRTTSFHLCLKGEKLNIPKTTQEKDPTVS